MTKDRACCSTVLRLQRVTTNALNCVANYNNATRQGTPILTFACETASSIEDLCLAILASPPCCRRPTSRALTGIDCPDMHASHRWLWLPPGATWILWNCLSNQEQTWIVWMPVSSWDILPTQPSWWPTLKSPWSEPLRMCWETVCCIAGASII